MTEKPGVPRERRSEGGWRDRRREGMPLLYQTVLKFQSVRCGYATMCSALVPVPVSLKIDQQLRARRKTATENICRRWPDSGSIGL